jgi:hypothetical protein
MGLGRHDQRPSPSGIASAVVSIRLALWSHRHRPNDWDVSKHMRKPTRLSTSDTSFRNWPEVVFC